MIRQRDLWRLVMLERGHTPELHITDNKHWDWVVGDAVFYPNCLICKRVWMHYECTPDEVTQCTGAPKK